VYAGGQIPFLINLKDWIILDLGWECKGSRAEVCVFIFSFGLQPFEESFSIFNGKVMYSNIPINRLEVRFVFIYSHRNHTLSLLCCS